MEQVCEALNLLCEEWQEGQRGTSRRQQRLDTLRYHQRRNRAARESCQKGCGRRRARPEAARGEEGVADLAIDRLSAVQLDRPSARVSTVHAVTRATPGPDIMSGPCSGVTVSAHRSQAPIRLLTEQAV